MQNKISKDIDNTVDETREIGLGYTKWQRDLYSNMSVDEIFHAASDWKKGDSTPAD